MYTVMHACTYVHTYMLFLLHHTAVITPPQLFGLQMIGSVARFLLGPATAERSERYISSLECTDLGVPLEVEFEETQSSGADGDMIDRHVSAPGAVYNVQIWSINGANFSADPVKASTTLLYATGKGNRYTHTTLLYTSNTYAMIRTYVYSIRAARYTAAAFHCTSTVPSVPRLLSVTRTLSDGFELNWLPPREPNGRPVYEIEYGTDDTNFTTVDTRSRDTYYNLTGLQHSTTYYIRVVAVNYIIFGGVLLRGEKSETVTGILVPEPGGDTTGGHCIQNTNMYCDTYSDMYSDVYRDMYSDVYRDMYSDFQRI